ncbi:MAG: hypothetical protein U1D30_06775 [Planctomycetota bacterium]
MRATIEGYLVEAQCELSGKTTECLLVSFADGFHAGQPPVREFMKLIRSPAKAQQEKRLPGRDEEA